MWPRDASFSPAMCSRCKYTALDLRVAASVNTRGKGKKMTDVEAGSRNVQRPPAAARCCPHTASPSPHHSRPLPDFRHFLGRRPFNVGVRSLPLPVKLPGQPRSWDSRGVSRKLHKYGGCSSRAWARARCGGLSLSTEERRWRWQLSPASTPLTLTGPGHLPQGAVLHTDMRRKWRVWSPPRSSWRVSPSEPSTLLAARASLHF